MLSVLFQTLGCKLNQLESEAITDIFLQAGFVLYSETVGVSPSVIIINTCTVTSKADQKARRVIRKALRDYPNSFVIVTGCYARLEKNELQKLDEGKGRLFVMKKDSVLELPGYFDETRDLYTAVSTICDKKPAQPKSPFEFNPRSFSGHTRSFLKIQDGCDKNCTYCRIRLARGASVSLEAGEVLKRLRVLEETHAEAVLTGVNISQYTDERVFNHKPHEPEPHEPEPHEPHQPAQTRKRDLAELLDYLLSGTQKIAIRLSSLPPESVDENLCKVLAHPRIRPHFHLSIQSCSEKILERMGRACKLETIENAIALLRSVKADPFLACDIICGFPGETETEFNKTYKMCEKAGFAWIHVFPYSKRPGTPAFSFTDTVREKDVTDRVNSLTALAWKGRGEYVKRYLCREVEAIVENREKKDAHCQGITENYLKALIRYEGEKTPPPGSVIRCKLLEAGDLKNYDVLAEFR